MNKLKLNESVAINNTHILESGEEVLIFSPDEYKKFVEKNKVNEVKGEAPDKKIVKEKKKREKEKSKRRNDWNNL